MISRTQKVRLGIFLAVSGAAVIITVAVLTGIKLMESLDRYRVRFEESVSGLEVGAQVKYNGVRVGQVSDIMIDPERLKHVVVYLELRQGTPVKADTKAVLTGMGITGLKFVELTGGSDQAAHIKPGGEIQAGHSFMGTLEGKAEDIAVKTELALSKINAVLSEDTIAKVADIISSLKNTTANIDKLVAENDDKVSGIISDLSRASKDLEQGMASANRSVQELEGLVRSSKPQVEEIVANLNETAKGFRRTAGDLARVDDILNKMGTTLGAINDKLAAVDVAGISAGVRATVDEASAALVAVRRIVESSRENIYKSTQSLKQTLRNLEDFSAEIREQPGLLLGGERPADRTPPED